MPKNGYFQSESMPDMHSKRGETPAQYCHQMNLAGVDCAKPLIIVYHFTAIVKLLLESAYSGILVPCCLELRFFHISKYLEYHWHVVHPPTNLWQLQTIQILQCGFCHLFPHCLYFPFTFGCFWSEFACFFKFTFSWQ